MTQALTLPAGGTLGNITGAASDGVLVGALTAVVPAAALVYTTTDAALCVTEDASTYVDETAALAEATADDVEVLPATPAAEDACYFGHATKQFNSLTVNITTQGDGVWTILWEYWDGDSWATLTTTDGTTGWTAAAGWVDVTFTAPAAWAKVPVDNQYGYWIRSRVSAYTSVVAAPQVGQGYLNVVTGVYTDETTDFGDAGAGDVNLLPLLGPTVGDGIAIGHTEKFCKLKLTTSQARTGTATITLQYWDGDSWESVTTVEDDSVGWSATAGAHIVHFVPPSDWAANTAANSPSGSAGYFVRMIMTAKTDVTAQPILTQGWVYPMVTGASGVKLTWDGPSTNVLTVSAYAQTVSGSTADSVFLLVNVTDGTSDTFTFTKATALVTEVLSLNLANAEQLAIIQVTEDGSTELADAAFVLNF